MNEALIEALRTRAQQLPFVSLVHWSAHAFAGAAQVGVDGPFRLEPMRFRCAPDLSFASAEVQALDVATDEPHLSVALTFGGLAGAASPLPAAMLEHLVYEEESAAERAYLDLFHHRLFSLFYRGLIKYDLARADWDRTVDAEAWVLALCGLRPEHAARVTGLPRALLLRLAPLLAVQQATAARLTAAVRTTLEDTLGDIEVCVDELRGGKVELDPRCCARLGRDLRLGSTSTLGKRAPAPSSAIVLVLGPLSAGQASRLYPGSEERRRLERTVALFCPEIIEVELELRLHEGPAARLGASDARLGRTWLGSRARPVPMRWRLQDVRTPEVIA